MSEETRSAIEASIASMRQDTPADGGVESAEESIAPPSESLDDIPEGAADEPTEEVVEPVADPAKPAEEAKVDTPEEDDDFSKVAEFEELKDGRKRVNRIPHPRVKKMIESATKKAEAALRETLGKEHGEKLTAAERRIAEYDALGEIMGTDADRFMSMIAEAYPAYKEYAKKGSEPAPAANADDPEPQPDGKMPDGTPGYTPEQWDKHEKWKERQIEARVRNSVQKEWKDKYGWLDKQREADQALKAQGPAIKAQIADAMQNWEGFEANADAIVTELRLDTEEAQKAGRAPKLSLHDAYRRVILKKHGEDKAAWEKERETLKVDRNKVRAELMEELKKAPKSTSAVPALHVPSKEEVAAATEDGDSPTKATIRASIRAIRNRNAA